MTLELSYPKPNPAKSNPRHRRIAFGPTILRLAPLLANRDYRSRELALELRLPRGGALKVREWCRYGLPHTHDATGHLLVNGQTFAAWVRDRNGQRPRQPLPPGHMWCPGCHCPQPFDAESVTTDMSGRRPHRTATCPHGHRMSQWVSRRNK